MMLLLLLFAPVVLAKSYICGMAPDTLNEAGIPSSFYLSVNDEITRGYYINTVTQAEIIPLIVEHKSVPHFFTNIWNIRLQEIKKEIDAVTPASAEQRSSWDAFIKIRQDLMVDMTGSVMLREKNTSRGRVFFFKQESNRLFWIENDSPSDFMLSDIVPMTCQFAD